MKLTNLTKDQLRSIFNKLREEYEIDSQLMYYYQICEIEESTTNKRFIFRSPSNSMRTPASITHVDMKIKVWFDIRLNVDRIITFEEKEFYEYFGFN